MKDDGTNVSLLISKEICLKVEDRLIWRLTSQISAKDNAVQKARRMLLEMGAGVVASYMQIEEVTTERLIIP
jgi:hypothetical protein